MELKKILCAVDLKDSVNPAVEYAKMLSELSGASISAIYVVRRIRQYFEGVAQSSHRVHDGFDIVIAVGPFRNDAQADVDLTVRKK